MNIDDYGQQGESSYAAFAEAVQRILETAIADGAVQGVPRPQAYQHRAKSAASLRPKLEERGILDSGAIERLIKDLAGVRIIFYTDTDIDRFLNSRVIPELFDVQWDETKIHHPNPENEGLYQAIHYTVRLKPETLAQPGYAEFAGLRCEIQIQTMLSHIWAETSHDILYKRPEAAGFGSEAFKVLEKRLRHIMRDYLVPAGHEFSKVQHDLARLHQGKALFDRGVLETLAQSRDNNERRDTLETIKNYVLPHYDDIEALYPELASALCDAVGMGRQTEPRPIPSEIGDLPGATADDITRLVVEIFSFLRYVNVELTFRSLADIFRGENNPEIQHQISQAVEHLAGHDLKVWRQAGPAVQFVLSGMVEHFSDEDVAVLLPLVQTVWAEALSSDLRGTEFGAENFTLSMGAVQVSDELKTIRRRSIDGLFGLFDQVSSLADKANVFADLMKASRTPSQGAVSNALYALTISDTEYIVERLSQRFDGLSFDLREHIEERLFQFYRIARQIADDPDDRFQCREVAASAVAAVLALRDRIDANPLFDRYKTLVGFEATFAQHWEDDNFDFEQEEVYRRGRASEFIRGITDANAEEWYGLIVRCASSEFTDGATFVIFGDFLRDLANARPHDVLDFIGRGNEALLNFLPVLLTGLSSSAAAAEYQRLLLSYVEAGQRLPAVVRHFRLLPVPPIETAEALLARALEDEDTNTVLECLAMAVEKHPGAPALVERIFVPAMDYLSAIGNFHWADRVWFLRPLGALVERLTPEQVGRALHSLVPAPKIDDDIERVLVRIAAQNRVAVWRFFGDRLAHGGGSNFEPVPYRLHGLEAELGQDVDLAIDTVRGWYRPDDELYRYRGGRLLAASLPAITEAVARKFSDLAANGADIDIDFLLETLPNYQGDQAILPILMEIVHRLDPADPRIGKVTLSIETFGVASGEFGIVAVYRAKKAALGVWKEDARPRVRDFVATLIRGLEQKIAAEQRSAEQRKEQRRLDFDRNDDPAA